MALADALKTTFSRDDFDFDSALSGLGGVLTGVHAPAPQLDAGAVADAASRLGQGDLAGIGAAVEEVLAVAGGAGGGLPDVDELLRPLTTILDTAERLTATDALDVFGALERAATDASGAVGLAGLAAPLQALDRARTSPPVDEVLHTAASLIPGLDIGRPVDLLAGTAGGIVALLQLLGALMATETLSHELVTAADAVGGMLDADHVDALLARLHALDGTTLAALIRDADPASEQLAEALAMPVGEFADAIRAAAAVLVNGMAFGEATLVQSDLPRLKTGLEAASTALSESMLPAVAGLALDGRAALEPVLRIDLGSPAVSLDAFWDEVLGLVGDLAGAIDSLDPAALAGPLTRGLQDALATLDRVEQVVAETVAAFRSAFQTMRQAVAAVDVRPVAETIRDAFAPITDALERVRALVDDAQKAIGLARDEVVTAMGTVKTKLGAARTGILEAFQRVEDALAALNLDQLQAELAAGVAQIADAVRAAPLEPVFDTVGDVIDGAADVVGSVPLDLLPDDVLAEFRSAAAPIKAIDFQDVSDELAGQLHAILDTLDTDVLDEVEKAYAAVLAFLEQIDPHERLAKLERDAFDPMLERVRAIDPAAVLEPVSEVLGELKGVVAGLDLRADVLQPLDDAFGELERAFAELDPSAFVAPLVARVADARQAIADTLQLDAWHDRLTAVDAFVAGLLDRVDFDRLVELLDAAWDDLRPVPGGTSAIGTLLSGLLEGSGLPVRASSFTAISGWIGGEDGAALVRGRMSGAVTALAAARSAAEHADVGPLVGRLAPQQRALLAALHAHPQDSVLRLRLEPLVVGADPLELLGTTLDNRARYLEALASAIADVEPLAHAGRSELTAIAHGLRDALRPLAAAPEKAREVLVRFGIDPAAPDLRSMLAQVFDTLRPNRTLAPLAAAISALKARLRALVHDGVIVPLQAAVGDVQGALDALDISFLATELTAIHDEVAGEIAALKPSALLGPTVEAVEKTQATIATFDPLGAARKAVEAMQAAVTEVADDFRPTTIFAPALEIYDEIQDAAGGLDVRRLLEPVLTALGETELQLQEGLDRTADALTRLQAALP